MKKTIITFLAFCGVAAAAPTEYEAYLLHMDDTSALTQEISTKRGQLWFHEDGAELTSWMVTFKLDSLSKANLTLFNSCQGTIARSDERYGLGVYACDNSTGVTIGKDDNHLSGAEEIFFPENSTDNLPVTLRLAYDGVSGTVYLYCDETQALTSVKLAATDANGEAVHYNLKGATLGGGQDQSGVATFWTDSGKNHFTVISVTDMSSVAGDEKAFVRYIPEPATATLSLLVLAGLASRRRRK